MAHEALAWVDEKASSVWGRWKGYKKNDASDATKKRTRGGRGTFMGILLFLLDDDQGSSRNESLYSEPLFFDLPRERPCDLIFDIVDYSL